MTQTRLFLAAALTAPLAALVVPAAGAQGQNPAERPFADPGNAEAKAMAAREGISTGEATRRLRLEHQAARAMARMAAQGQSEDQLIALEDGKVVVYRAPEAAPIDTVRATFDTDLQGAVTERPVAVSPRRLKAAVAALAPALAGAPGFIGFQLKRKAGELAVLSSDPAATQRFIADKGITLPEFARVAASDPIVLTATVRGGRPAPYTTGSTCAGGTWGFVVYETANPARRGILTAAHVSVENSSSPLYFPTSTTFTNCGSGTSQSLSKSWRGSSDVDTAARYGVDISYHRNASDTYDPSIWDGSAYRTVRYQFTPPTGSYLCKFGQITRKTCGTLQDSLIWSNGYGYMSWIAAEAGVALMVDKGDSGGPVWSGITYTDAVGITHAQWGKTNMLYSELATLQDRATGLALVQSP